jgi:hypothetical protein
LLIYNNLPVSHAEREILVISVKGEGRTTIGFGQGERLLPPVVKN